MCRWILVLVLISSSPTTFFLRADDAASRRYRPLIDAMHQWLAREIAKLTDRLKAVRGVLFAEAVTTSPDLP